MDWLLNMLKMGNQGGGAGGAPFGLGGSSGPADNTGMPISGVGPGSAAGAPLDISAQGPGGNSPGLLPQLAAKFGIGNGGAAPGRAAPNTNNSNPALNVAQGLLKSQPITPAQFNWMPMAGPR